jgi:Fe-S-cluster containining protein
MSNGPTLDTCIACKALCCRHVALPLDTPSCKRDYDNIRWSLMHDNVNILVDHDGDWLVEFVTRCSNLKGDNTCGRYDARPRVCRTYPGRNDDCEFTGEGDSHKLRFTTAEELERYLDRRKVAWRYKSDWETAKSAKR